MFVLCHNESIMYVLDDKLEPKTFRTVYVEPCAGAGNSLYTFGSFPRFRNMKPGSPPDSDCSSLVSIVSSAK